MYETFNCYNPYSYNSIAEFINLYKGKKKDANLIFWMLSEVERRGKRGKLSQKEVDELMVLVSKLK